MLVKLSGNFCIHFYPYSAMRLLLTFVNVAGATAPSAPQFLYPGTWEWGGGQWGSLPPNFGALPPPTLNCPCCSFFFACELESLPKNSGPNLGSFWFLGRGYLGPQETFAPPPQLKNSSCIPTCVPSLQAD